MSKKVKTAKRYWIAINGPSVACCAAFPLTNPVARPTPKQLVGFPTSKEAQHAQHVCLTAPMGEVEQFVRSLAPDIEAGRVVVIRPNNPEPPAEIHQPTIWAEDILGITDDGAAAETPQ